MTNLEAAFVDINERNRKFWAQQEVLRKRRMDDRAILETAMETIASEYRRQVPVRNQTSFYEALQEAEAAKIRFLGQQARRGGKASKADSLQVLIEAIVRNKPDIACNDLLPELWKHVRGPVIDDIDERLIYFRSISKQPTAEEAADAVGVERRVTSKCAPISGLKHRLTRARKKLKKR